MVNFYRRFIKHCARISKPLTQLTVNTPFTRDNQKQRAFESFKQVICTAPVLRTFDPKLSIVFTTDATGLQSELLSNKTNMARDDQSLIPLAPLIRINRTITRRSKNLLQLSKLSVIGAHISTVNHVWYKQTILLCNTSPPKTI